MKIPGASAVLTGVALVAFISLIALVAFFAGVAFVAFFTVNSCGFHSRIGRSDPPVAVFTDEGGVSVRTVLAVGSVFSVDSIFSVYTILAVSAVSAVESFQNRKIVQVQPYFIADIAPLQGVFAYTEFRCLSVSAVCAFLPSRACDIAIATRFCHSPPS